MDTSLIATLDDVPETNGNIEIDFEREDGKFRFPRIRRQCNGTTCGGKNTIHRADPHTTCFHCRGAYHDLVTCTVCNRVPPSTKSTWAMRCQYWRNHLDPEGPPPSSKPYEGQTKKSKSGKEAASGKASGSFSSPSKSDLVPKRDVSPRMNVSAQSNMSLNSTQESHDFGLVIANYGSAENVFSFNTPNGENGVKKETVEKIDSVYPERPKKESVGAKRKSYEIMQKIIEDGVKAVKTPKPVAIASSSETLHKSALSHPSRESSPISFAMPEREPSIKDNTHAPQEQWSGKHKICVEDTAYFALVNKVLEASPELVEQGGVKCKLPTFRYAGIRGPKVYPAEFPLEDTIKMLISDKQNEFLSTENANTALNTMLSRYKVTAEHLRKFENPQTNPLLHLVSKKSVTPEDKKLKTRLEGINETQYLAAKTGVSLADHLLIFSQHGLAKLREFDLEELRETLKVIQKIGEDLLMTSLVTWDTSLATHRNVDLSVTRATYEDQEPAAVLSSPVATQGYLFGSCVDKAVVKASRASPPKLNSLIIKKSKLRTVGNSYKFKSVKSLRKNKTTSKPISNDYENNTVDVDFSDPMNSDLIDMILPEQDNH